MQGKRTPIWLVVRPLAPSPYLPESALTLARAISGGEANAAAARFAVAWAVLSLMAEASL
jgi:hypothetical protein